MALSAKVISYGDETVIEDGVKTWRKSATVEIYDDAKKIATRMIQAIANKDDHDAKIQALLDEFDEGDPVEKPATKVDTTGWSSTIAKVAVI